VLSREQHAVFPNLSYSLKTLSHDAMSQDTKKKVIF